MVSANQRTSKQKKTLPTMEKINQITSLLKVYNTNRTTSTFLGFQPLKATSHPYTHSDSDSRNKLIHPHTFTPMAQSLGAIWGCSKTLLHAGGFRDRTAEPLISGWLAQHPEPQLLQVNVEITTVYKKQLVLFFTLSGDAVLLRW